MLQRRQVRRFLTVSEQYFGCRHKSFRVKRQFARMRKSTASYVALEHFDFFYKPIYGRRWPSVRLGLLSDQKYCALLNNYSNCEENRRLMEENGAVDILETLLEAKGGRNAESELPPLPQHPPPSLPQEPQVEDWEEERRGEVEKFVPTDSSLSKHAMEFLADEQKEELMQQASLQYPQDVEVKVRRDEATYPEQLRAVVFPRGDISLFPQASVSVNGVLEWYLMDAASLLPVIALGVQSGDTVLDLCAAPGGKTLTLLQTLLPGGVVANDSKMGRVNRMRRMLTSYVPESADIRERVVLKRKDASSSDWDELNKYDKVLVDAPCTTDRHSVTGEGKDVDSIFQRSRSKERLELPGLQTKILVNGLRSVRPGGSVVYSTCTLSPLQNESVIEAAIGRAREVHDVDVVVRDISETVDDFARIGLFHFYDLCKFGHLVLPFVPNNFGPMYVCKMQRVQ